jgi:hypothetical protein
VISGIDPLGRAAYGVLCIAGMAGVALPVLVAAGPVGGVLYWIDGQGEKALAVWLLSWLAAVFAALLFSAGAYIAWPFASDWITEWHGYATAFATGGAGLGLMALLVFATPVSLYLAVVAPLVATFAAGFGVAGRLPGVRAEAAGRTERPRPARRR